MKIIPILFSILALVLVNGCANGAGRKIVKGAARGASHGAVEQYGNTEIGKGAAHGALSATHQVTDQNRAQRKAEKAAVAKE